MWAAITAIFAALAEWLRLKQLTAAYELSRRIDADIAADENQITALRARGDDAAQLSADRLRQRIVRTQGVSLSVAAYLPAAGAPAQSGAAGADGGGDLHPADR